MCRVAVLVVAAACLAGCGYSVKELYPDEYHTVASPIFDNRTFYRQVEFELSEAIKKEIEKRTPYKIAAPAQAQTILQGTITKIEQDLIARRDPGGVPEQVEVTIWIDFEWKDLRSGEMIVSRRGFSGVGWYAPTTPVSETYSVAQHLAVERLARDVVSEMRSDW